MKVLIGSAIVLCAFCALTPAAVTRVAAGSAQADIKVLGTSNLHNWSMEDKDVACSARFVYLPGRTVPGSLAVFTFSFPVHSLKSGESGMDSRAYAAMKAKTGGTIVFTAASSTIAPGSGNEFSVKSSGSLTIAGISKPVALTAACSVREDGSITCTGTNTLLMTDYQIKPPTYMLGALKTGNALTIDFTMVVGK